MSDTDGDIDYSGYSGAQLLSALDSVDGRKYPRNLDSLRREIARRPAPQAQRIGDREIVDIASVQGAARSALIRECMIRVFWLQFQYGIGGAVLGLLAGYAFRGLLGVLGIVWAGSVVVAVTSVVAIATAYATYWAYTKWLLHAEVGGFTFALLRVTGSPDQDAEAER